MTTWKEAIDDAIRMEKPVATPKVMQWQLVGEGDVIVLNVPGEVPTSVAVSDAAFVEAIGKLIEQAKSYPTSMLRKLRLDNDR